MDRNFPLNGLDNHAPAGDADGSVASGVPAAVILDSGSGALGTSAAPKAGDLDDTSGVGNTAGDAPGTDDAALRNAVLGANRRPATGVVDPNIGSGGGSGSPSVGATAASSSSIEGALALATGGSGAATPSFPPIYDAAAADGLTSVVVWGGGATNTLELVPGPVSGPADVGNVAGGAAGTVYGPFTTAFDAAASQVRAAVSDTGLTYVGSGITVGILSDSFNVSGYATQAEASGWLPPTSDVDIIRDETTGTDEGLAMAEIAHELAPGASIDFYTADISLQSFAAGIVALASAGCKVICDDVTYLDEPFFQTGLVAAAIQTVEQEGVTFVTAAGNNGEEGYLSNWTPVSSTTYDGVALTDAQNFGNGSPVQTVTISAGYGTTDLLLQWNQPDGHVTTSLKMLVFRNGTFFESATAATTFGSTYPIVGVGLSAGTYQVAVEVVSGSNPGVIEDDLYTDNGSAGGSLGDANAGTVIGHHTSPDAITVAAVDAGNTAGNGNGGALQNEEYSASGEGTELWFNYNGTAVAGAPAEYDPVALSGIDDIATSLPASGGLNDFFGTSAATPSVAAVCADMLSADPNLTPMEIEAILEQTATGFGDPNVAGAGLVDAATAVQDALAAIGWAGVAADWYTAANWTSGHVPGAGADALVLSGTVSLASGNPGITVAGIGLNTSGILNVSDPGQTQTVSGSVTVDGTSQLSLDSGDQGGSALAIGGALINYSTVAIGNASMSASTSVTTADLINTGIIKINGNSFGIGGPTELGVIGSGTDTGAINLAGDALLSAGGGIAVLDDGIVTVGSGAAADAVTVANGGGVVVLSGGAANGTTIGSVGSAIIAGGVLGLTNSAAAAGTIAFAAGVSGGELLISGTIMPASVISGFATGDTIDLRALAWSATNSATYRGTTLTVSGGGGTADLLTLAGIASGTQFAVRSDGNGGTDVGLSVADTTTVSEHLSASYSGNENSLVPLGGLSVSATPNTGDPLTVTLSVGHGVVSAGGASGAAITLSGTAATLDAALAGASYSGAANYAGADTLSMVTSDTADGSTASGSAAITLADTTTVSEHLSASYSGSENSVVPLGGLSVSATPNTGDPLTVTLSVGHGVVSAGGASGAAITLSGTAATLDAALAGASYSGAANYAGADTLSMVTSDTADGSTASGSAAITLADTTTVSEHLSASYSGSENSVVPLGGLSVSATPNTGDPLTVTLSVGHGVVSAGGASGAAITLSGTAATLDAALAGASYSGAANYAGADTLSMVTSDTADGSTASGSAAITLADTTTVSEHLSASYSGSENSVVPLGGLSVSATPNTGDPLTVTLSVGHGVVSAGGASGAAITLSGTAATLDAALAGASYSGAANYAGADTLSMVTSDTADGSTASGSAAITLADTTTVSEHLSASYSGNENSVVPLGGLSVSATPNTGDPLTVTLSVGHGVVSAGGASGAAITLSGTAATLDAALAGASYSGAANYAGADTLSMVTSDTADGSTASGSAAITLADTTTVSEHLSASYSGSENSVVPLGGLSVSATPNTGDPLTVTLSVGHGVVSAGGASGAAITLSGTAATLDAALAGASYSGAANYAGADTLSMVTSDTADGSTASGSAAITLADTTTVSEHLSASYSGSENSVVPLGGLSVSATPNTGDPLTVTLSVGHGVVSAGGASGAAITLSGTAATLDAALAGASYSGAANYAGADTLSMVTSDTADGSTASGSAAITLADTTTVSEHLSASYSGSENSVVPLGGLSVSATPNTGDPLTVTLSVGHGVVSAGGASGAAITLSGTAATLDAALAGASYSGAANYAGADTLSMVTSDTADGSTASGSAAITLADTTTVSEHLSASYSGSENSVVPLGGLSVSATPNTGDPLTVTLSVGHGVVSAGGASGAAITLSGTAATLDAALAGASYSGAANYAGADTLSMVTSDTADGSTASGSAAITLADTTTVSEHLSASYSGNENSLVPLGGLSVSATPNTGDPLTVTLSVGHGVVSAGGASGAAITLSGTAATLDAALAGASYSGAANYAGADTLSMVTSDTADGSTASGSAAITLAEMISGFVVSSGVTLEVASGGTAIDTTVMSGGTLAVDPGGLANLTVISSGGSEIISSGGADDGARLLGGGVQKVFGLASGAVVSYLGSQTIYSGGVASATTVSSGGRQNVSSGGAAVGATLSGGTEYIYLGGVARTATIASGGIQYVFGTASGTSVNSGGTETVASGGTASGTSVNSGGTETVANGGTANSTIISSGGTETVGSGGAASATMLLSGGTVELLGAAINSGFDWVGGVLEIAAGYTLISQTVGAAQTLAVLSGGTADNLFVSNGGSEIVLSGSAASAATIVGGNQYVFGTANSTIIGSGGIETVESGGVASGTSIGSGGLVVVSSGGVAPIVTFVGSGELQLDGSQSFTGVIGGFALGDELDLRDISYASGSTTVNFAQTGTSGTLRVTSGSKTANLTLIGTYVTSQFILAGDGHGGTMVTDPPVAAGGSSQSFSFADVDTQAFDAVGGPSGGAPVGAVNVTAPVYSAAQTGFAGAAEFVLAATGGYQDILAPRPL